MAVQFLGFKDVTRFGSVIDILSYFSWQLNFPGTSIKFLQISSISSPEWFQIPGDIHWAVDTLCSTQLCIKLHENNSGLSTFNTSSNSAHPLPLHCLISPSPSSSAPLPSQTRSPVQQCNSFWEWINEKKPGGQSSVLVKLSDFARYFSRGIHHHHHHEALISIKPPEVYKQGYMYSWVNIAALLAVHLVHGNFT